MLDSLSPDLLVTVLQTARDHRLYSSILLSCTAFSRSLLAVKDRLDTGGIGLAVFRTTDLRVPTKKLVVDEGSLEDEDDPPITRCHWYKQGSHCHPLTPQLGRAYDIVSCTIPSSVAWLALMVGNTKLLSMHADVLSVWAEDTVDVMRFLRHLPYTAGSDCMYSLHWRSAQPVLVTVGRREWRRPSPVRYKVTGLHQLVCGRERLVVHEHTVSLRLVCDQLVHGLLLVVAEEDAALQCITLAFGGDRDFELAAGPLARASPPVPVKKGYYVPLDERVDFSCIPRTILTLTFARARTFVTLSGWAITSNIVHHDGGRLHVTS